eukprot:TRINITY_DN41353_c0_g1_i2.p1 TRINITY_DN41353_c0_g1~~TRINITY_DN41353_c0_g1_i2.p1  ORF type:complete len:297 (-),score=56.05 TRINITY_DN41353_c0_g1_i2:138-1028(-)
MTLLGQVRRIIVLCKLWSCGAIRLSDDSQPQEVVVTKKAGGASAPSAPPGCIDCITGVLGLVNGKPPKPQTFYLIRAYAGEKQLIRDLTVAAKTPIKHASASVMNRLTSEEMFGGRKFGIIFDPRRTSMLAGFPANLQTGTYSEKAGLTDTQMLARMVELYRGKLEVPLYKDTMVPARVNLLVPQEKSHLLPPEEPDDMMEMPLAEAYDDPNKLFAAMLKKQQDLMRNLRNVKTGKMSEDTLERLNHNEIILDISCESIGAFYCLGCDATEMGLLEGIVRDPARNPCGEKEIKTSR